MSSNAPQEAPLNARRRDSLKHVEEEQDARSVLQEILRTLRRSSIVPRDDETKWVRFWNKYTQEADAYDREFLERYRGDMNNTMVFSGLLTAALATVASMTISGLSQDPNDLTHALLQNMLVAIIALNGTSDASLSPSIPTPTWNGPSTSVIWFQTLLYSSLVCSLLVALGAVLALQWLSRYNATEERGTVEDRCKRRQQKFDGLQVWHFRAFLEALPLLLQFSLLLFGVSLCAFMWDQQHIIASVLIAVNGVGGLLWVYTVVVSAIYPDSPYDTPLSDFFQHRVSKSSNTLSDSKSISPSSGLIERVRASISTKYRRTIHSILSILRSSRKVVSRWLQQIRRRVERDVEADLTTQTIMQTSPLTVARELTTPSHGAHLGGETASPPTGRAVNSVTPLYRAILSTFTTFLSPLSPSSIITAHQKRIARSNPSSNEVRGAAILWLKETSTDPEIHTNTLLVTSEVIWPDKTFAASFDTKTVDFILERLKICFEADGHPKTDSVDRIVSLCASFLLVYWQLHRLKPDVMRAWTCLSGGEFVQTCGTIMATLVNMDLKEYRHPAEDSWILKHTFLTLHHFKEAAGYNFQPDALIATDFMPVRSTARLNLRVQSLVSLAQVSCTDLWPSFACRLLFTQIEDCDELGHECSPHLLLATAYLFGFTLKSDTDVEEEVDWSQKVRVQRAAAYILDKMEDHVLWSEGYDHHIAFVFDLSEQDRLSEAALDILSRILHILCSGIQALPNSWASSSHFGWLVDFASTTCHRSDVNPKTVLRAVSGIFSILTSISDIRSRAHDEALHVALGAVVQLSPSLGTYADDPSVFHTFVRMQHTTISFIYSLAKKGLFCDTDVPTFAPSSCTWDLSHPRNSEILSAMPRDEQYIIKQRNSLFVEILHMTEAGTEDIPRRRAWFNDPRNDQIVRQWIYAVHQFSVPYQEDLYSMMEPLAAASLLDCERFRQPTASHWGDDFICVQQTLVAILWWSWSGQLIAAFNGQDVDFSELVESTLLVSTMETEHAVAVEYYLSRIVDFRVIVPRIPEKQVIDGLTKIQAALEMKLADIAQWKSTGTTALGTASSSKVRASAESNEGTVTITAAVRGNNDVDSGHTVGVDKPQVGKAEGD
ncbi:hypothetical protein BXZ70DRAFT_561331 [Cristinia sonorae]|uniref:DUF6535 domain-containing protein n=1 Tax=Cristinia sonorae TaxID=1940300 RepID=A0A8K0UHR7_9AGAR|nr:hypothetical protein BXZ70DRAFT_561331 [Cristinia sonorae]